MTFKDNTPDKRSYGIAMMIYNLLNSVPKRSQDHLGVKLSMLSNCVC